MYITVAADFDAAAAPFRHELVVHCYRMLGSVEDAEDVAQETLIRAWKAHRSGKSNHRQPARRNPQNSALCPAGSRKLPGLARRRAVVLESAVTTWKNRGIKSASVARVAVPPGF